MPQNTTMPLTISYSPVGLGQFRVWMQFQQSLKALDKLGLADNYYMYSLLSLFPLSSLSCFLLSCFLLSHSRFLLSHSHPPPPPLSFLSLSPPLSLPSYLPVPVLVCLVIFFSSSAYYYYNHFLLPFL